MNHHICIAHFFSHQNHQPVANPAPSSSFLFFPLLYHFVANPRHHPIISYIDRRIYIYIYIYTYMHIMPSPAYYSKGLADTAKESLCPHIGAPQVKNPTLTISFTIPRSRHLEF